MKNFRGKNYIFLLISLLLVGGGLFAFWYHQWKDRDFWDKSGTVEESAVESSEQRTLNIWYSDEALTDYINSVAVGFLREQGIHVNAVYHDGLSYLDDIADAQEKPDVYVLDSTELGRAALLGLAMPVEDPLNAFNSFNYPEVALQAVTYKGYHMAYPLYYDTTFLLYNETYLREIADTELRAQMGITPAEEDYTDVAEVTAAEGGDVAVADGEGGETISDDAAEELSEEELQQALAMEDDETAGLKVSRGLKAPEGYTEEEWKALVDEKMKSLIPASISDIIGMASNYGAPEGMEHFLLWDVSDIFYNYFFTGAYMNVGGPAGDDEGQILISSEDAVKCLAVYQNLHQFFSIESKESDYEAVIEDFLSGKSLFTIASADILKELEDKTILGTFPYGYGVAPLPGVDQEHAGKALSLTGCVVVNGMGSHPAEADLLAETLAYGRCEDLIAQSGKLPCAISIPNVPLDAYNVVGNIYRESAALPKIPELSDFWLQLELAYTGIWDGGDPRTILDALDGDMRARLTGQ